MPEPNKPLGILTPLGGGDPVPLKKESLIVGRRATCDIVLDFENVSGKHCELRFINGLWHIRDLGSSNGTFVNGAKIVSDQSVMPDVELGIATHLYHIDYEPFGPAALMSGGQVMDEEIVETRKKHSLLELAGLETDDKPVRTKRPPRAPAAIERVSADEADFDDAVPENYKPSKPVEPAINPDDFFNLIEDEVKK